MGCSASYVHRFLVLDLDDIAYQNTSSLSFFLSLFAHKYVGQKHGALVQWEETRNQKVVSSNPGAEYWMDIFYN